MAPISIDMARVIGILFIVAGIWVGLEVYTEGVEGAFGGMFAGWTKPLSATDFDLDYADEYRSNLKRVGDSVQQSLDEGMKRYESVDR